MLAVLVDVIMAVGRWWLHYRHAPEEEYSVIRFLGSEGVKPIEI
jgi:hypothetical protein